jgi:hypothetical protein
VASGMKIYRETKTFYGTKNLIECPLPPFPVYHTARFDGVAQHSPMKKRRPFATFGDRVLSQPKRRNDSTEASIPTLVPQPSAFLAVVRLGIVRSSQFHHFRHRFTPGRSFRGGQGVYGCEPPPACRVWYLCWRFDCVVCVLLHGR